MAGDARERGRRAVARCPGDQDGAVPERGRGLDDGPDRPALEGPMTALRTDDADEARVIEAVAPPTRYARGWHCLGLAEPFKDGEPHAIQAFGTKLVVF